MAKLSKIRESRKPFVVDIAGEIINVEVFPNRWTGEFVDTITDKIDQGQGRFLAEVLENTVASWDLEYDPEVDKDAEGQPLSGVIPLNADVLHGLMPITIMGEILKGIREAMSPNPKTSSDSGSFS